MPISKNLRQEANEIFEMFTSELRSDEYPKLYTDTLISLNLNSKIKETISEHFSTNAQGERYDQSSNNTNKSFEEKASHGFVDSFRKSIGFLKNIALVEYDNDEELFTELVQSRNILQTTINNAKKLEIDNGNIILKMQITRYEALALPLFNKIIDEMENNHKMNAKDITEDTQGVEKIRQLPENILEI